MKIFTAIAALQLFLLVTDARGTSTADDSKRVVCFYLLSDFQGTLEIEDIDPSLCTHLIVDQKAKEEIVEDYFDRNYTTINEEEQNSRTDGMLQKFRRLKERNPALKLIVQMQYWYLTWIKNIWGSNEEPKIPQDAVRLLREMGFDGIDINLDFFSQDKLDEIGNVICDMKTEFDKHGYIITTFMMDKYEPVEHETDYSKVTRCCESARVFSIETPINVTQRLSSLSIMNTTVKTFIRKGIPPNKIVSSIPAFGNLFALENPQDSGIGARMDLKRTEFLQTGFMPGVILYRELMRLLKNESLEWTFRRDEETKEPYAISKSGLWTSYEDKASVEIKAKFVEENGLGGICIFPINIEDSEDIAGEGRFPLIRAAYNTFRGGLQTEENTL